MGGPRWVLAFCRTVTTSTFVHTVQSLDPQATSVASLCAQDHLQDALSLFHALRSPPDTQTYAALFHACARLRRLDDGREVHRHLLAHFPLHDLYLTNHMINFYAKCGCLSHARQLFDQMAQRNIVSWTALISGYNQHGEPDECFRLFARMLSHHFPNEFAFGSVLSSRAFSRDLLGGRQVHLLAIKTSFDKCVHVGNALITMYSSCSTTEHNVEDDWLMFQRMPYRNVITWNSMISGFLLRGHGLRSIQLFVEMRWAGICFDRSTLVSLLSSCSSPGSSMQCSRLHSLASKTGLNEDVEVATALVKAYSMLGSDVDYCYQVFLEAKQRDLVSWTGIIMSCAENRPEEAIRLLHGLRQDGFNPDRYTFSIVLKACAGLATARQTSAIHGQIFKTGYQDDVVLSNALIHAYSRCGTFEFAECVFVHMQDRDIVSWNSMIKAYAMHGRGEEALLLFSHMDLQPDATTFVGLLTACSHAGLVSQGCQIFNSMLEEYGTPPQCDHYACMVDILGRAGLLTEAEDLINQMPIHPDSVVWSALLAASRKHGKISSAQRAAKKLIELQPHNSLGYVTMANIYCSKGNFSSAGSIRKEMKQWEAKKEPGLSWIEIQNRIHEFASGGIRHPRREVLFKEIERLVNRLKERGYVPETSLVLHEIEEEHKEKQLYYHSEKLALGFGLMMSDSATTNGAPIRIMKNIRICLDCHNFMKLASDCVGREIVIRDANRFHHFKGGSCSCKDYW
ncbi:pentatricopeptide repeat-containing protein At1g71420 [Aristolochia californica]|uniref:pentatricopeptide repeat-containing protein At1g71420 n=1 Tax=Aristolochia californica TaxID=171875 RepID=UPI0035DF5F94